MHEVLLPLRLGEVGYVTASMIYPRQLPAALELVTAVPEQRFVIDHLAKPEIKAGQTKEWEAQIRAIAQNSKAYCKVSGMVTEANWGAWSNEDFAPYLDVVFEAFGTDRLWQRSYVYKPQLCRKPRRITIFQ